jgi:hypothetical protein
VVLCFKDKIGGNFLAYRVRARNARSRATPRILKSTQTLTRQSLTTIAPINNALAAIKLLKLGEKLVY